MNTKRLAPARLAWIVAGVMAILVVVIWFRCFLYWPPPITDIYLIRHAEKADASSDPPLSAAGQVRAQALAHVLANTGIAAIYVTGFQRTQETAAPLAIALGLNPIQYQATDAQGVVTAILAAHTGARVLVVAHSNTVDDIAAALGVAGVAELDEQQFDRLFVIHRFANLAHIDRLRYGSETP